jgi:hypothetical protein
MLQSEFDKLVREHFDISDDATRKCIIELKSEVDQNQLLTALSSKLYDMIVAKVDKIDFGTIPKSRGDITRVDGFANTEECLRIMRQIVLEYKEDPACVDTVITAISNLRDRKATFIKAFSLNMELPMILYNTMVLAIEESVSFLISVCIAYVKDPATQDMNSALNVVAYNNAKGNLLFEQIMDFNAACANKQLDDLLKDVIKNGNAIKEAEEYQASATSTPFQATPDVEEVPTDADALNYTEPQAPAAGADPEPGVDVVNGSADTQAVQEFIPVALSVAALAFPTAAKVATVVGGIAAGVGLTLKGHKYLVNSFIPMLRNIVYFFVSVPIKMSDAIAIQAQFIEANAYKLQSSTSSDLSDEKKAKVVKRQLKIADIMSKFANKLSVDNKKAEKAMKKQAAEDIKKYKIDDFKDELPADIYNKSVLF